MAMKNLLIILFSLGLMNCAAKESLEELEVARYSESPETIEIKVRGYKPQSGRVLEHFFVSNFSVRARQGRLSYSTSRGGLTDQLKGTLASDYGFSTDGTETSVRGFSDLLIYLLGIKLSQQLYLHCAESEMVNSANDAIVYSDKRWVGSPVQFLGLRDCEKNYLGLDRSRFDNDGDGIPDYLELRCGLNPANRHDALATTAGDGVTNIDKCKRNIPIDESAFSPGNKLLAYRYEFEHNQDGSKNLRVANLPVLNGGMDNLIALYIVEKSVTDQSFHLASAFMILPSADYIDEIIEFDYWVTDPAYQYNQEIALP